MKVHDAAVHDTDDEGAARLRAQAVAGLKKRQEFYRHLVVFVLVNGFLTTIWALTNADGFFWPIFPMVGWGIGLVMNAWDVWNGDGPSEARVMKEMRRLQSHDRQPHG